MLREPERLDKERQGRPTQQVASEGARYRVLELVRGYFSVSRTPRHRPKMASDHLGYGELVDRATSLTGDIPFPGLPVGAWLQQQLLQIVLGTTPTVLPLRIRMSH
jgi:hypothetical protein